MRGEKGDTIVSVDQRDRMTRDSSGTRKNKSHQYVKSRGVGIPYEVTRRGLQMVTGDEAKSSDTIYRS
jgi:uncharacterized protein YjhX (UPF0386 family)